MERQPVVSTNLAEVGYDPSTGTMEIEFRNGRVYQYFDVPPAVYHGFVGADSAGRHFHEHVKGLFRYARK